jgi:hypothetical protein
MQPYRIEGVGELIYFEDTEGNLVGAMQYDPAFQFPEMDGDGIRSLALSLRTGAVIEEHSTWGQLVFAASGVMRVCTASMAWLTPPTVPSGCQPGQHRIEMESSGGMRTLYIGAQRAAPLPARCRGAGGDAAVARADPAHPRHWHAGPGTSPRRHGWLAC